MGFSILSLKNNKRIDIKKDAPLVLGRGDLLDCSDKRVSRRHGQLFISEDGQLHLLALHTNPCFFMNGGAPPILQIKKDQDQVLQHGDYIALLPDTFWYEVVVDTDVSSSAGEVDKTPEKVSQSLASEVSSSTSKTTPENVNTSSLQSPSTSAGTSKESDINIRPAPIKIRKLPAWMYEIEGEDTSKKSPSKRGHIPQSEEDGGAKKIKIEVPETQVSEKSDKQTVEPVTRAVNDDAVGCIDNTSEDSGANETSQNDNTTGNIQNQPTVQQSVVSIEGDKSDKSTNNKDGYESNVVEPESSNGQQSCSTSAIRRPMCQYEASCYRKNPQHRLDFSHPGDADFIPVERRPVCQYGSACYRQNPMHRVEFQHPANSRAQTPPFGVPPSPPGENRPLCYYSSLCYRQNPQHQLEFYHPPFGLPGCFNFGQAFPFNFMPPPFDVPNVFVVPQSPARTNVRNTNNSANDNNNNNNNNNNTNNHISSTNYESGHSDNDSTDKNK